MERTLVVLVPVVCAGIAVLFLYWRLRAETARVGGLVAEVEKLRGELEARRDQLAHRAVDTQRRGGEVDELRRKLEKAKKRAAREREERSGDTSRIRELEEALRGERATLASVRGELTRVQAGVAAARSAGTPERSESPTSASADRQRIEELEGQLEKAEKAFADRDQKLAAARKETFRARGKLRTQEKVYMQLRGELEAKKDRLKTQREELERLRAYKVALIDAASTPAPEARGGAALEPEATVEPDTGAELEVGPESEESAGSGVSSGSKATLEAPSEKLADAEVAGGQPQRAELEDTPVPVSGRGDTP